MRDKRLLTPAMVRARWERIVSDIQERNETVEYEFKASESAGWKRGTPGASVRAVLVDDRIAEVGVTYCPGYIELWRIAPGEPYECREIVSGGHPHEWRPSDSIPTGLADYVNGGRTVTLVTVDGCGWAYRKRQVPS
jgi:hypothetical protein